MPTSPPVAPVYRSSKTSAIGRWRIVEMEVWDTDVVDLLGPAYLEFDRNGQGSFRFVAVEADGRSSGRPRWSTRSSSAGRARTSSITPRAGLGRRRRRRRAHRSHLLPPRRRLHLPPSEIDARLRRKTNTRMRPSRRSSARSRCGSAATRSGRTAAAPDRREAATASSGTWRCSKTSRSPDHRALRQPALGPGRGEPGASGENWLLAGGDEDAAEPLPDKCTPPPGGRRRPEDLTPGGGGWGPPEQ